MWRGTGSIRYSVVVRDPIGFVAGTQGGACRCKHECGTTTTCCTIVVELLPFPSSLEHVECSMQIHFQSKIGRCTAHDGAEMKYRECIIIVVGVGVGSISISIGAIPIRCTKDERCTVFHFGHISHLKVQFDIIVNGQ